MKINEKKTTFMINEEITKTAKEIVFNEMGVSSNLVKKLVLSENVFILQLDLSMLPLKILGNNIFEIAYTQNNILSPTTININIGKKLNEIEEKEITKFVEDDLKIIKDFIFEIFGEKDVSFFSNEKNNIKFKKVEEKYLTKYVLFIECKFFLNTTIKKTNKELLKDVMQNVLSIYFENKGFFESKDIDIFYNSFIKSNSKLISCLDIYDLRFEKEFKDCPEFFNSKIEYETFKELLFIIYKI